MEKENVRLTATLAVLPSCQQDNQVRVSPLPLSASSAKGIPPISQLRKQVNGFKAGQLRSHISRWKALTSDKDILHIVSGLRIPLTEVPSQHMRPSEIRFSPHEEKIMASELKKLLALGVIVESFHESGEFISNIFIRPKKDGTNFRLILNLRRMNQHVEYHHFKMENLNTAVRLMRRNCYFASIDLKDAYYSVPIAPDSQKLLKFLFNGTLYHFTCMPNGLACAPRIFTKLLKPVYGHLRSKGFESVAYIDDSCLFGQTFLETQANVSETVQLFQSLGFTIHPSKSVLDPSHCITFLGFKLNSCDMTVRLTPDKVQSLQDSARLVLKSTEVSIREVARLVGKMNSSCAALEYGPIFYRSLEHAKGEALKKSFGNFDAFMRVPTTCRQDIQSFVKMAQTDYYSVSKPPITLEIRSDASQMGFGGVLIDISQREERMRTQGQWTARESLQHINVLELEAAFHCLNDFCSRRLSQTHVRLLLDSTTAVCYISNMGGSRSPACHAVARKIWDFCRANAIHLTVSHIPGIANDIADAQSRYFNSDTEWMLSSDNFACITRMFGQPAIDLFASRINHQFTPYVSWQPDGDAYAVDAFSLDWSSFALVYIFPPFSLLPRVLQKVEHDRATSILVYPHWPTQPWFPKLQRGRQGTPLPIPMTCSTLMLPQRPREVHPLWRKLRLEACLFSGMFSERIHLQPPPWT